MKIVTIDGLPVYSAQVADNADGMLRISLVDDPAVQSDFLAFSKQGKAASVPVLYAVQDEEKRLVLGVVMRADFPIYRRQPLEGENEFEFYVIYRPDTIRAMAEKYLAENRQNLVNLMHKDGTEVDGVQMVQYFIKGAGLSPEGFEDISDGSLFAEFHVTNDDVWDAIKAGTYKGFSLEGYFTMEPEEDASLVERIVDALDGVFSRTKQPNKLNNMSKKKGLIARLIRAIAEMGNVTTDKGVLQWDGDEDLKAGDAVWLEDADGNRTTPEDGDYTTEDGKVIVVAGGKVSEIRDAQAEVAPAGNARFIETDKGKLEWDDESRDLQEGDAVYITDEEGNRNPAPDGDYVTEDGKTIVVVDGKVASITDPKAEVAPQNGKAVMQRMERIATAFQETYDEKLRKLYDAIVALGFSWPWIVEAGEEFVIAEIYTDAGDYVYYRFNITEWNEEGYPVLESGVKVVPAYVTPEEKEAAEVSLRTVTGERDSAKARIVELEARVKELESAPAVKAAHDEVTESGTLTTTGNKRMDTIARIMAAK